MIKRIVEKKTDFSKERKTTWQNNNTFTTKAKFKFWKDWKQ